LKSPMSLWSTIAEESAMRCHTSATKDINTVLVRQKHEGFSFLTITLPSFGKEFQKALDQGIVSDTMFRSFSRHRGLPRFLGGFLRNVFCLDSGVLRDEPCIDSILAVRQLTLMFQKVLIPCSNARDSAAMHSYVTCEQEVKEKDASLSTFDYDAFQRMSNLLFSGVFSVLDRMVSNFELVPKHGPGATADKLRGNSKYRQLTWTDRLEQYFPCGEYMFPSVSHFWEHYDDIDFLEPGAEIPVKVITVPKTQKTPRIIAIEPTAMQYAQQSLLEPIVELIERDSLLGKLIGFTDQGPNQAMARESSLTGTLATLDLSDASDRVSNQLVRTMLHNFPNLNGAVDACRSRKADVPGFGEIRLAKFASMGSALCFPFEAMVFLTCVSLGIERSLNTQFTKRSELFDHLRGVRIYGDDIITPIDSVYPVVGTLEHFGARVGADKSFWIGKFRESCGKEYYNGHDVSLVKVRRMLPATREHVPEVISAVSLRNQLYEHGYWGCCQKLDGTLKRMLKHFPRVLPESSVLGRYSFLGYDTEKECEKLHTPLVKGYVVSSRIPSDPLDGHGALLKYFLKRGGQPTADRRHLERAGRPRAVDIKPRWAKPF
jgi:hypothetical protein